jgi:hypothetical protein
MADPEKKDARTDIISISSPKAGDTILPTFTAIGTFTRPPNSQVSITCHLLNKDDGTTKHHPTTPTIDYGTNTWQANFSTVANGKWIVKASRTNPSPVGNATEDYVTVNAQPPVVINGMMQGASVASGYQTTVMLRDLANDLICRLLPSDPTQPAVPVTLTGPVLNDFTATLTANAGVYTFEAVAKSKGAMPQVVGACRIGQVRIT